MASSGQVRIDKVVTSGTFSADGETFDVDNNVWLVGDDSQVVIVDAAHDAAPIVAAVGGREVVALLVTHGHDDHISAAADLISATSAPVWLNPADRPLWDVVLASAPDHDLVDGSTVTVGDVELTGAARARSLTGQHLPVRAGAEHAVQRGHAVPGRAGQDDERRELRSGPRRSGAADLRRAAG
jgi:hypothetical protein